MQPKGIEKIEHTLTFRKKRNINNQLPGNEWL